MNAPHPATVRSLRLLLESYATAELPEWGLFSSRLETVFTPAGKHLYRIGDNEPNVYFIERGLLKAQAADHLDRLVTVMFIEEGDILASMSTLGGDGLQRVISRGLHPRAYSIKDYFNQKARHTVTAIEDSVAIRADFLLLEQLSSAHLAWAKLVSNISLMYAAALQADAAWLRSSAEERFRIMSELNPDLIRRITQRDLAGFLNVTEASLSRIVKRVRLGKQD